MPLEIESLETDIFPEINGYYVFDREQTDATFDDLTWNNRGNGPEPTDQNVHGPFRCKADALEFISRYSHPE